MLEKLRTWALICCLQLPVLTLSVCALGISPLSVTDLSAQPVPPQRANLPDTFAEVVDVRVVNLEVVVENEEGERVRDLQPEDFLLYVDGHATPVEFFTEVTNGRIGQEIGPSLLPPGLEAPAQGVAGTSYLLFLDEYFSPGWSSQRILKSMLGQLEELGPADQMAVVAFDGRRLRLVSDWTNSPEVLAGVLQSALERRPALYRPIVDPRPAGRMLRGYELPNNFSPTGIFDNGAGAGPEIRDLINRLRRTQRAVEASMRGFASVPGRRVMLLTAGDWPMYPAEALLAGAGPTVGLGAFDGGENFWSGLYQSANRFGFTLYPLDASTPTVTFAFNDGARGPEDWGHALRQSNNHATLYTLAEETGGRAFVAGRAMHALSEVVADTRSYYWLGFSPQLQRDDEYHDIRVEVTAPGLSVRHRSGFLDRSRATEVAALAESALLTGHISGADPLEVLFGTPERSGRRKVQVPIRVHIPSDQMVFLPQGDVYRSQLELRLVIVDGKGQRAEVPVIPVQLASRKPPEPGEGVWYETTLEMRRAEHRVVAVLSDVVGGTVLSTIAGLNLADVQ